MCVAINPINILSRGTNTNTNTTNTVLPTLKT